MAAVLAVCDEYRAQQWAMVIHADETVVQVLKENGKRVASESGIRLYASGVYSKNHVRASPTGAESGRKAS